MPARDSASLPPVCSASALVLMMCRIGFELSFAIASSNSSADRGRLRVDDDDGLVADLHGRVAAGARDHEHVALRRQNLELGLRPTAAQRPSADEHAERARAPIAATRGSSRRAFDARAAAPAA